MSMSSVLFLVALIALSNAQDSFDLCPSGEYNGTATCDSFLNSFGENITQYCSVYATQFNGCCSDGMSVCFTDYSELCPTGEYNGNADFVFPGYDTGTYTCDQGVLAAGGVESIQGACSTWGISLDGCCSDSLSVCFTDYSELCPTGEYDGTAVFFEVSSYVWTCDVYLNSLAANGEDATQYCSVYDTYFNGCCSDGMSVCFTDYSELCPTGEYNGNADFVILGYDGEPFTCDQGVVTAGGVEYLQEECNEWAYSLDGCCSDSMSVCHTDNTDSDNIDLIANSTHCAYSLQFFLDASCDTFVYAESSFFAIDRLNLCETSTTTTSSYDSTTKSSYDSTTSSYDSTLSSRFFNSEFMLWDGTTLTIEYFESADCTGEPMESYSSGVCMAWGEIDGGILNIECPEGLAIDATTTAGISTASLMAIMAAYWA